MKDINELKDYRLKYKRYYDIDFDKDYAIHHIDMDRNNNDIDNLLLLPRGLHNKLHLCFDGVGFSKEEPFTIDKLIKMEKYNITSFRHLGDTLVEVERWVRWKYYNYDAYIGSIIFGDNIKEIING